MDTKLSLAKIEHSVLRWFDAPRRNKFIKNLSYGLLKHECDVVIVSKSKYLTEIEIKRSFSDFLADFKKKHHHDDDCRIKNFYYCLPESIVDKAMAVLREKVEDKTLKQLPAVLRYNEKAQLSLVKDSGSPLLHHPNLRPLTEEEYAKLLELNTFRLYDAYDRLDILVDDYHRVQERYNEVAKCDKIRAILNQLSKMDGELFLQYCQKKYKLNTLNESEKKETEDELLDIELQRENIKGQMNAYQNMLII